MYTVIRVPDYDVISHVVEGDSIRARVRLIYIDARLYCSVFDTLKPIYPSKSMEYVQTHAWKDFKKDNPEFTQWTAEVKIGDKNGKPTPFIQISKILDGTFGRNLRGNVAQGFQRWLDKIPVNVDRNDSEDVHEKSYNDTIRIKPEDIQEQAVEYNGKRHTVQCVQFDSRMYCNAFQVLEMIYPTKTRKNVKTHIWPGIKSKQPNLIKFVKKVRIDVDTSSGIPFIDTEKVLDTKFGESIQGQEGVEFRKFVKQFQVESTKNDVMFELLKDLIGSHDFDDVRRDLQTFKPQKALTFDSTEDSDSLYHQVISIIGKYIAPKNHDLARERIENYEASKFAESIADMSIEDLSAICDKIDVELTQSENTNEPHSSSNANTSSRKRKYRDEVFRNVKRKLPSVVRNHVWLNVIGEQFNGKCVVCKESIHFLRDSWHCSHIVAKSLGGSDKIDNLTVCCPQCNLSMGTQNLNEFKESYF